MFSLAQDWIVATGGQGYAADVAFSRFFFLSFGCFGAAAVGGAEDSRAVCVVAA